MTHRPPRIGVRALILHENRLLVVNAWPGGRPVLWCAPGGGVNPGTSLPENLRREVQEETGIAITVGAPALVNEFHDPDTGFHQIEVFFRASIAGPPPADWTDPEGIVTHRRFVTRAELARLPHKPDSLAPAAWGDAGALSYDPLERILR